MSDPETFEQRSCLRKTRYETMPDVKDEAMYTYACDLCGGWHLATKKTRKNGDLQYTKEGWPIVRRG